MPLLSDRQRVEIAIPAYLLFALTETPGVFQPIGSGLDKAERAKSDIAELRQQLKTACFEPVADLPERKQGAILRRVERIAKIIIAEWTDRSAMILMLTLWYFIKDLIDREVLILWEGSTMAQATTKLLPMFTHGFEDEERDGAAQAEAVRLLARLQREGLYGEPKRL